MPSSFTSKSEFDADAIVVGAGLSGLAAAIHLSRAGKSVLVLEASDGVGGRVRSDYVDGFILDRGFQVLLTAYPEARAMMNYSELDLRAFKPGSLVRVGNKTTRIGDPFREPTSLISSALSTVGNPIDKARIGWLRRSLMNESLENIWERPETSTKNRLHRLKFSDTIIERFFRPFFAGVQLDETLNTSSRMFDFVFKMLAEGDNAIPSRGIGTISTHLAAKIPAGSIRLQTRVAAVSEGSVTLLDQAMLRAPIIVVATEGPQATKLLGEAAVMPPGSQPVTCVYFSADRSPINEPIIMLNGNGNEPSAGNDAGPINNLCVPSLLSPMYAPVNKHLVSVSVVASHATENDSALISAIRKQATAWFGAEVSNWNHLRTYHIPHAQPSQPVGVLTPPARPVKIGNGLFVCGDHVDNASINGALVSGRRAAEAALTS
jgi:phytoene dehydrogenase-like protein